MAPDTYSSEQLWGVPEVNARIVEVVDALISLLNPRHAFPNQKEGLEVAVRRLQGFREGLLFRTTQEVDAVERAPIRFSPGLFVQSQFEIDRRADEEKLQALNELNHLPHQVEYQQKIEAFAAESREKFELNKLKYEAEEKLRQQAKDNASR